MNPEPGQKLRKEVAKLNKDIAKYDRKYAKTIQAENQRTSRSALTKQTRKLAFKLGRYGMNLQLLGEHELSQHETAFADELQMAANRLHMLSLDIQWARREQTNTLGK